MCVHAPTLIGLFGRLSPSRRGDMCVHAPTLIGLLGRLSPSRRGSTGFGQEALASLPGNIGTNDILDCMAALQQAVHAGEGELWGGRLEASVQ